MRHHGFKVLMITRLTVGVLLSTLLWSGVALALDPRKAITQYSHNVWQTDAGLPQNSVYAIVQTRDGYLWLGTQEGLVRFDGARFTVFDMKNTKGIKHSYITALFEDAQGSLWIGTNAGGLSQLKDGRFTAYSTDEGLSSRIVRSVYGSKDGGLWVGTGGGGLDRFKDGRFTTYTTRDGLSSNDVMTVYEDREGVLWIGTEAGGLSRFKDGRFSRFMGEDGLLSDVVLSLHEDREGNLWIGTRGGGLYRLKDGRLIKYTTKDGLTSKNVMTVREDRDGNLWVGTNGGGLNRFANGTFTAFTTQEGLSSNIVSSLWEDREGSLWIGTNGGGLNRLKDGKFLTYTTQEGLANNRVRPIYESQDGSVWIGTEGGGLSRLKDGRFTTYTTRDGLVANDVRAIHEGSDGSLWIGTSGGLNRLKDGRFTTYTTKNGLVNDHVRAVYEDEQGNLWVGTNGGLNRVKDGVFTTYTTKDGLANNLVRVIYQGRDGSLWVGTNGGLNRFKDGKWSTFTMTEGLSGSIVLSLYEDRSETLWIGTAGGGLNRFKDGRFTAVTTKEGLFDDNVFQILEDGSGNLWMSCNRGVFRVSRKELDDFAAGRISLITSIAYGAADGMKSSECDHGAPGGYKTRDGKLWFPTIRGVVVIDPSHIAMNRVIPPVVIEQVVVDRNAIDLGEGTRLSAGSKNFEFHYTGLSLLAPEKVRFKYKLEGFDKEWIDAETRRVAYYTNIPPGTYRFRVIACNNDGVWNEAGASVEFYLKPHVYQTTWFYALCVLLLVALGTGGYRLRVRRMKAREKELALLVDERTKELQQEITERKRVEEKLRLSDEILQRVNALILVADSEGRITYVSPATKTIVGYELTDLLGDGWWNVSRADPLERKQEKEYIARSARGEIPIRETPYEGVVTHQNGEQRWILWHDAKDPGGFVIGVGQDITERKRAEEELQEAKEAAEAATQAKSDFLASMSHEIRTPMNGVIGMIGLLLDTDLTPEQREYAETVRSSADILLTILNEILDFSKIEAGKLTIEPMPFDLQVAVEEVADLLAAKAHEKGLDLILRYAPDAPRHVIGDAGRIRQVLTNLVDNAIKFTHRGHVLINVEIDDCRLQIADLEAEGAVSAIRNRKPDIRNSETCLLRFSVTDTGIGIAEEKLDHVFEKFTQADASTTRRYGGTGLGLAICRQLVELMGGCMGVTSRVGEGSTFWFTLPLPVDGAAPATPPAKADLKGVRVLIVDDNEVNRRVLHEQISSWGMRNGRFASGEEALTALREAQAAGDPYQIAIIDYRMPDMDGEMLGRAIKADPLLRDTVLVMLTSSGLRGEAKRMAEVGFATYLVKPVRQSQLMNALATAWGAHVSEMPSSVVTRPLTGPRATKTGLAARRQPLRARVLVVEDNIINQKVAVRMLEKLGCRVDMAANGKEAVEMVELLPYDLIFMDCEMPEMDGFEATAIIRAREAELSGIRDQGFGGAESEEQRGESKSSPLSALRSSLPSSPSSESRTPHIPIIAMTAHAMKGDRERCLAAGMDAYIPKPVQPKELFDAIAMLLPSSVQPESNEPDNLREGEILERAAILARAEGDLELVKELVELFLSNHPRLLSEIRDAIAREDSEGLRRAAHTLKGSVSNFAAQEAVEAALHLEMMGRDGDLARPGGQAHAEAAYFALEDKIERLKAALTTLVQENVA